MKYRIREVRKSKGWTIMHLAERVGTSKGYVSDLETGKRAPSTSMLAAIAEALGVPEQTLYATDDPAEARALAHFAMFLELRPEDQESVARHARGLLPKGE